MNPWNLGVFFCWQKFWMFPKIGVYTPKWMVKIMENPIKMDDLGVPLFLETPKCFLFRFSKMKPHTFEGSGFNWVAFLFWLLFLSDEISPCQGQIGVIFLA